MNEGLQTIVAMIRQNESLTAEQKAAILQSINEVDKELEIILFKLDRTEKVKKTTAILLEETIGELEQKRKAVDAHNRELEIEAALERVRAKVMAMNSSKELNDTSLVFGEQLRKLGIDWQFSYFWLIEEVKEVNTFWITWPDNKTSTTTYSWKEAIETFGECIIAWKRQDKIHSTHVPVEDVQAWLDTFERITADAGGAAIEIMKPGNFSSGVYFYDAIIKFGSFGILTNRAINEEEKNIQVRFATEFERAYTRFLDLQKAEAQTRESQIELGLERVRARAMAMQKSEELKELIGTVFTELIKLDLVLTRCVIIIYNSDVNTSKWWMANSEDPENPNGFYIKQHEHPPVVAYYEGWKERKLKWTYVLEGQVKKDWDVFLFNETELKFLPDFVIKGMKAPDKVYLNASFNNFGNLTLATLEPLTDEHFDILLRFAKVFDLTYTRFNDLKQAEAQAREARIEAALEKVRSRSLAMHKSDELQEVVNTLFEKLRELDIQTDSANIAIFKEGTRDYDYWVASDFHKRVASFHIPYNNLLFTRDLIAARESGTDYSAKAYSFEEKNEWFNYAFKHTDFKLLNEERKKFIFRF